MSGLASTGAAEASMHGAAGDFEPPGSARLARCIELCEQGDPVAAGHDLERHDQRLARRVPIETDLGAVDRNAPERIVEIDDGALVHHDTAIDHARNAVGADIGADARRQRQVRLVLVRRSIASPASDLWRTLLRLDVDDAMTLLARASWPHASAKAAPRFPSRSSRRCRRPWGA